MPEPSVKFVKISCLENFHLYSSYRSEQFNLEKGRFLPLSSESVSTFIPYFVLAFVSILLYCIWKVTEKSYLQWETDVILS